MTQEFEILYQLVFLGTAVSLVLLERVRALQRQPVQIARRWTSNIGLFIIGSVVDTLVLPVGIYAFALHQAPGFVSRLGLSFAVELLLTFLVLDLWRYWEHRLLPSHPVAVAGAPGSSQRYANRRHDLRTSSSAGIHPRHRRHDGPDRRIGAAGRRGRGLPAGGNRGRAVFARQSAARAFARSAAAPPSSSRHPSMPCTIRTCNRRPTATTDRY